MMEEHLVDMSCTVELKPGEKLTLPQTLVEKVGPGRWIVTVRPCPEAVVAVAVRRHGAFLSGYAPEDEGLYDDLGG